MDFHDVATYAAFGTLLDAGLVELIKEAFAIFPVSPSRELAAQRPDFAGKSGDMTCRPRPVFENIPCIFPVNKEVNGRDWFASERIRRQPRLSDVHI